LQIEVFDATDPARHLGSAYLADQASEEQRKALRAARDAAARALRADWKAAERLRRDRYGAATTPEAPRRLGAVTTAEAAQRLARTGERDLADRALPDLIPPREPPASWVRPIPLQQKTAPNTDTSQGPDDDSADPAPPPRP
ncbi:Mu transposase C-terminal domain-containing protein, partial [Kitasatospora sp. NPDC001159]